MLVFPTIPDISEDPAGAPDGVFVTPCVSIEVVDKGVAKSLTTSTAKEDIYAFFFDQKGLMAGLGLQGSKITKIDPD